jgi:hypothetical protein
MGSLARAPAGERDSVLAREPLPPKSAAPGGVGAATRLEALTRASVHLLRLEAELRRVASEAEAPALEEALAGLRVVFRTLIANDATSPTRELAEGTAA